VNAPERPLTIPAALDYAAAHFRDSPAYVEGQRRVTWGEVAALARDTAAGLEGLGLRKGDRVAICAENSIDWIVAYHATVLAGAVAALVYFDLAAQEIEEQIRRPVCRVLFASTTVLAKISVPACVEHVVLLGPGAFEGAVPLAEHAGRGRGEASVPPARENQQSEAAFSGGLAAEPPSQIPVAPDDLAAIIYTSGTTGGAKGVMLSHRNLMSNTHAILQVLDVSARDVVLLVLPLHHAMPFIATLLLPTMVGAHFVIENDLRRIRDRLQEYQPTIFFGVPALYELVYRNILARAEAEGRLGLFLKLQRAVRLLKALTGFNAGHIVFRSVHRALGGRLRFLVSGGAALNVRTARDYFSLGLPLLQGWGMSEAAPAVALQTFNKRRFRYTRYYERRIGSVGKALPGVEVRLADVPDKGINVAETGEGEVLVRGQNIFVGYWDAPEETAAAMQDGWLRTGDLARIDRDGSIYLTGRSKYVIVLDSGEKVIPDELEEALSQSELVADVCVLGRRVRDKVQVTAVIHPHVEAANSRGATDAPSLSRLVSEEVDRLCRQLAPYKRVQRIELSDAPLPKTPLRKVARGHIAGGYEFDYGRWLASADEG
jgi:long-chain acyl-CoA synthetase